MKTPQWWSLLTGAVVLGAAWVTFLLLAPQLSKVGISKSTGSRESQDADVAQNAEGGAAAEKTGSVPFRGVPRPGRARNRNGGEVRAVWAAEDAIPNEYLLSFYGARDQATFMDLAKRRGVQVLGQLSFSYAVRIRVRDAHELEMLLREAPLPLEQGPNFFVRIPNVPEGERMQPYPGGYRGFGNRAGAWLGLPADHSEWGNGVTVAILDNGVGSHPDLPLTRIVHLDMLSDSTSGTPSAGTHGTAVCSLICGAGKQINGVAPAVSVLSIRTLSETGVGDTFTLAAAIVEAVNRGAKVINLCLGTQGDSFLVREAVRYALDRDVALVAAAGNDALEGVVYPARYEGVVAVAAVDAMGRHLFFSNRGPEIDIAAPGWDVVAAGKDGGLVSFSGTSAAVPFVAGTIAALLSRESALTTSDAIQILLECADDTGPPGKDAQSGYGILNIARILRRGTTGICDVAVALPYVSPDASPEGLKTVTVYGQNRGTMPLAHTELVAEVAGQEFRRDFYDVGVGAIFVMPLQIPTNLLNRPGGVPITGVARVPGIKDETPENNMVSGVLLGPSS